MLSVLRFVSFSDWKMQKKFKNRLWKSRACVPLSEMWLYKYVATTYIEEVYKIGANVVLFWAERRPAWTQPVNN